MFDKIPSLKDFVLYLMPGIVICYLGLDILNLLNHKNTLIKNLNNNSISFVFIVSSFLIGFFCSQLQIILFGYFLKKEFKEMRTINKALEFNQDLKMSTIDKIKNEFNLENDFGDDDLIIFSCMSYIKSNANENCQLYVERYNYLSSFAMTLFIPLILTVLDILLRTELEKLQILIILMILALGIILILIKIAYNFRDDFYKNIFRQFLVTK